MTGRLAALICLASVSLAPKTRAGALNDLCDLGQAQATGYKGCLIEPGRPKPERLPTCRWAEETDCRPSRIGPRFTPVETKTPTVLDVPSDSEIFAERVRDKEWRAAKQLDKGFADWLRHASTEFPTSWRNAAGGFEPLSSQQGRLCMYEIEGELQILDALARGVRRQEAALAGLDAERAGAAEEVRNALFRMRLLYSLDLMNLILSAELGPAKAAGAAGAPRVVALLNGKTAINLLAAAAAPDEPTALGQSYQAAATTARAQIYRQIGGKKAEKYDAALKGIAIVASDWPPRSWGEASATVLKIIMELISSLGGPLRSMLEKDDALTMVENAIKQQDEHGRLAEGRRWRLKSRLAMLDLGRESLSWQYDRCREAAGGS